MYCHGTGENQSASRAEHTGEGGLLGATLHPDFENNRFFYLYKTTRTSEGTVNRVLRYVLTEDYQLEARTVIIDGIPGHRIHTGVGLISGRTASFTPLPVTRPSPGCRRTGIRSPEKSCE